MKTLFEKEKKLFDVLKKLNNFDFHSIQQKNELDLLNNQKNQLEIEKKEITKKYKHLELEYEELKFKLNKIEEKKITDKKREQEFTNKIDELNQETDNLIYEIDKWQT